MNIIKEVRPRKHWFQLFLKVSVFLLLLSTIVILFSDLNPLQIQPENDPFVFGDDGNDVGYEIIDTPNYHIVVGWTDSNAIRGIRIGANSSFEQSIVSSSQDIFIRFESKASNNVITYIIGGRGRDLPYDAIFDGNQSILIAGLTSSEDFPVYNAEDSSYEKGDSNFSGIESYDGFLIKINLTGNLVWGTFLGGLGTDYITDIEVDDTNNIYVSGYTTSSQSIAKNQGNFTRGNEEDLGDGMFVKYNSEGRKLWGYYIGGSGQDILYDFSLTNSGVMITGTSNSPELLNPNSLAEKLELDPLSIDLDKDRASFVLSLNLTSLSISWLKILSVDPLNIDQKSGNLLLEIRKFEEYIVVEIDNEGDPVIGLSTMYGSSEENKNINIQITKIDPNGKTVWTWNSKGTATDRILDLKIDRTGSIIFTGKSSSTDYPTKHALSSFLSDGYDAIITKLDRRGNLEWSSYIGGGLEDVGMSIALVSDEILITGFTSSSDLLSASNTIRGLTDTFFLILPQDLQELGDFTHYSFLQVFDAYLKYTSIFEILMIVSGIFFGIRSYIYFRKTKIYDYLVVAGIFVSILLTSYLSFFAKLTRIQQISDLIIFRQPFLGWTLISGLILIHAYRLRWYKIPKRHAIIGSSLLFVKLCVLILVVLSNDYLSIANPNPVLVIGMLLGFLLFDIYAIFILIYAYSTVEVVYVSDKIKTAHTLWKIGWFFYILGYLILTLYTILQILLFQNLTTISENLLSITQIQILTVYRVLDQLLLSGIGFFIVVMIIGVIALRYPEGVLLSQVQIVRAVELYPVSDATKVDKQEITKSDISDYLREAKRLMELDAQEKFD